MRIVHYFDYKSPYAYLAQDETKQLAAEAPGGIEFLPYTLDIPSYLGQAEIDEQGRVLSEKRNAHQWRRVRYAYMDCRREASRRGIVLRGPRKIFDSSVAHIGYFWAKHRGEPWAYHDEVFVRFWRRELDIEDPAVIAGVLESCGIETSGFEDFVRGAGREEHDRRRAEAEAIGVFGVPSYVVDGEIFWGTERMDRVRERIRNLAL